MAAIRHLGRWRPSAILDLFYPSFEPTTTFHFMGYIFHANGIMIRSDVTEILGFSNIAYLTGKCLFGPIFQQFWGILTLDFDPFDP